jgi:hypothetical protein
MKTTIMAGAALISLGASSACISPPTVELRNATGTAIVVTPGEDPPRNVESSQSTRFAYTQHLRIDISGRSLSYDMPVWAFTGRRNPYFAASGTNGALIIVRVEPDGALRALPPEGRRQADDRTFELQPPEFPVRPRSN